MNVNESGIDVRINVNEDITSYTPKIELTDPDGVTTVHDATIGASDFTVDDPTSPEDGKTYKAGEWAFYTLEAGDVDQVGTWFMRLRCLATAAGVDRATPRLPENVNA